MFVSIFSSLLSTASNTWPTIDQTLVLFALPFLEMFKSILTSALLFTGYFLGTSALPSELEKKQVVEATLTFHGGPASYSMTFAATGQVFFTGIQRTTPFNNNQMLMETENDLNINHIDIDVPDDYQCKVYVKDPVTGYRYPNYTGIGNKRVPIGPPAPVYGVSCFPSCQPVYGTFLCGS